MPATNAPKPIAPVKARETVPILIIAIAVMANVQRFPTGPAVTTAAALAAATFLKAAPSVAASIVNLITTVRLKRRARAA
jgi:hypothetical protein